MDMNHLDSGFSESSRFAENILYVPPNKSLHWPPVDAPHVFCHGSCGCYYCGWQQPRQLPGDSELNR